MKVELSDQEIMELALVIGAELSTLREQAKSFHRDSENHKELTDKGKGLLVILEKFGAKKPVEGCSQCGLPLDPATAPNDSFCSNDCEKEFEPELTQEELAEETEEMREYGFGHW